jgi:type IV pilus assembly protein PilO
VAIVILGLYFLVLYAPLSADAQREFGRKTELDTQAVRAQQDLRRYNDDVAELERSRTHARELARILPDTPDIPGFMRNINTLAEASGLSITLIQPEAEHVEQYFVRVPVRLEVTGSYLALARFFRSISQLPRVINMENITLEQPAEENGEMKLHARVLATTFRSLGPNDTPPPQRGQNNNQPRPNAARPSDEPGGRR